MALINNQAVSVGDRLYDVTQGYGTVTSIAYNRILVKFDNGYKTAYDDEGRYGGVRRLYWHNPVIIEPKKDPDAWAALTECMIALAKYFR